MIPVSLYVQNFLSYGESVPPLDFSEFEVACLSGNNGHGKSAILDAMTWALWGEARKASGEKSPSDGLLRIGTTEMQVEFVFDLEGDRYRALRKFRRKKRSSKTTTLDFQVFDEASHSYKSLTEKTSRATQEKINATLRMNYDTFINSAFILQGRVDEFTKKTPRKRKEILAEILDLLRYDQLVELAQKHLREVEKQRAVLEAQLQNIETELSHKQQYEEELTRLKTSLEDVEQKQEQQTTTRQSLDKQLAELRAKQIQLTEKTIQKKQLTNELGTLNTRRTRQQRQIAAAQNVVDGEKTILEQYVLYLGLQKKNSSYEEKLQHRAALQEQKRGLERTIQQAQHSLEKEHERFQAEYTQIRKNLEEIQDLLDRGREIEEGFLELQTSRKQDELWEESRSEARNLELQVGRLEKTIEQRKNELSVELHLLDRHIQDVQKLANQEEQRLYDFERCQKDVSRLEKLENEWEQNQEAGAECRVLVDQLKEQRTPLQERLEEAEEKLELLRRSETPQCPLCSSSLEGQKKDDLEKHFARDIQQIHNEEKKLEKITEEEEQHLTSLRTQYKKLEKQIASLKVSRERLLPKAESALEESRKAAKTLKALQQQHKVLHSKIEQKDYAQEAHAQLKGLQEILRALDYNEKDHQSLKKRLKTLRKFEGDFSKLEEARSRQRKSLAQLPKVENEKTRIHKLLDGRKYAQEEQAQLQQLISQIEELGYDEQAHVVVREELQHLQHAPEQKVELEQNKKLLPELQHTLDELLVEEEQKKDILTQTEQELQNLSQELTAFPIIERELQECQQSLQIFVKKRDQVLQNLGTYQAKYEHCLQLEQDVQEKLQQKQQIEKDCTMYSHLARIFGKDGMQAYLIQNAIPEIEDEANEMLARLTGNRTHITIESLKDLQSGGTRETLDIKISDELGTRSYEMYSGGEAFRVDFAIRIALSKLLAKRAGTKLKTLVIDEGFGTQDAYGLEQLVDAIKAISLDFEKILVITHLEALKEAFPVRIEVVKLPDVGSTYQIVH
ncbi:hypothetical protein CSA56_08600 [candidate division KSB3 bacterium]|uniref:Zinc-hook domain-containing protein n=1 Tax=candidate division KSB3 bacterium TaxID=2044937 RepID=A0A2G6KET0_9BACT|nr:MAG: hypothetical protein CSA56_08600 [candidate division KSB3 bacterium]